MPYNLSIVTAAQKNLIASDKAFLVCLEIDVKNITSGAFVETIYLVNNNENITVNGINYNAFAFDMSIQHESGSQPTVSLTIEDISSAVQQKMQEHGGGVGFEVRIKIFNEVNTDSEPEIVETFEVIDATAKDYVVSWTLGTENLLGKRFPNRRQLKDRCTWVFKSGDCGYTGSDTTCDYSLQGPNGCGLKNNTRNYGGFPGIKSNGIRYAR